MGLRMTVAAVLVLSAGVRPVSAQAGGEAIEVPLSVHAGRLVVPVEVTDGTELAFLVTTAAGVTVFSETAAARFADQAGLTLAGLPVPTEETHTVPDDDLTIDGKRFDGMIGANMLNQFDVLIDAPGERLVLKPIGRSVDWEGVALSDPVRLRVYHGTILGLDVELDGTEYPATLDLTTPTLVVNEGVRAGAGLDDEDTVTLGLAGTIHPDLPVRVLDLEIFRRWSPNGDGFVMVGAALAHDCAISLSWVHQEMRTCVR
jgi:hypothetical protein